MAWSSGCVILLVCACIASFLKCFFFCCSFFFLFCCCFNIAISLSGTAVENEPVWLNLAHLHGRLWCLLCTVPSLNEINIIFRILIRC